MNREIENDLISNRGPFIYVRNYPINDIFIVKRYHFLKNKTIFVKCVPGLIETIRIIINSEMNMI